MTILYSILYNLYNIAFLHFIFCLNNNDRALLAPKYNVFDLQHQLNYFCQCHLHS